MSQSQNFQTYKKQIYDWSSHPISYQTTSDSFKKFDAYVVSEDFEFYMFGGSMQVHNHLKLKANNQKGIEKISTTSLPINFSAPDESYYDPERNRDTTLRPLIRDVEVVWFGARIIKEDGSVKVTDVIDYTKNANIIQNLLPTNFYAYFFLVKNLKPNEILEIDYLYNFPYKRFIDGYSITPKINFSGKLPKENYTAKLEFELLSTVYITGFNQAEKFDTTINFKKNRQTYYWKVQNLFQTNNESCSHPFEETPYVKFYFAYPSNSAAQSYKRPMMWFDLLDETYNVVKNTSLLDPELKAVINLYKGFNFKTTDTSALSKLKQIHHYVNYELKYSHDSAYFYGTDNRLTQLNENLKNKQITARTITFFYKYLFDVANVDYYLGIVPDKRVDVVHLDAPNELSEPMYFFVLNDSGKLYYFYPKIFDHGWHVNEMPYYVENQSVLLVRQNGSDLVNPQNYILHQTPSCLRSDNYRGVKSQVNISLSDVMSSYNSSLILTGQMSTMGRAAYTNNLVNQYANMDYATRLYDLGRGSLTQQGIRTESDDYPYKAEFSIDYNNDLIGEADNKKVVQINRLIMPIMPYKFEDIRTTNFYSDFMYKDNYRYMLKFDRDVKLENINEEFTNTLGKINFSISQVDARTYSLVCIIEVYKSKVPPNEYNEVKNFYSFLTKIRDKKIAIN